ncbi:MAG: TraR/DksA family transcriptional regulator [Actinomycetota bacterium]|nr:TraR/DksA family transcriptional regulator [Actinomycetota bacterium]
MTMDSQRASELLNAERARIEQALTEFERGGDEELSHVDQHVADEGSELFEQERDAGLADRLREELAAVQRAEERVASGTFGFSIESGDPIPDARLEAMPTAERTVEEQARYDRGR